RQMRRSSRPMPLCPRRSYDSLTMKLARAILFLIILLIAEPAAAAAAVGDHLVLGNPSVLRELTFDGNVWRTTRFARTDGSDTIQTVSDEFHILNRDESELTTDDYTVDGEVQHEGSGRF